MTIRGPFAIVLVVLLFVSVGANLVIAGFTIARFAGPRPGGEIERIVALGIRAFPPEIQRDIGQQVRGQRDKFRASIDAVNDARQRMFETMRADPFDRAALDASFADVRSKTNDVQVIGQDIVANALAKAPLDVRRRIKPPRGPFP